MDVQLKRGLLEICVLAAIKRRNSYGYQIIEDLKPYVELSESTLYPILRRLESAKMLSVYSVEYSGRLRKYYRITPEGVGRLAAFDEEWNEILRIHEFITEGKGNEPAGISEHDT